MLTVFSHEVLLLHLAVANARQRSVASHLRWNLEAACSHMMSKVLHGGQKRGHVLSAAFMARKEI